MRGVRPRNLRTVLVSKTSTLNNRTGSCISPSCHSLVVVGHWYQLTNKGEEAVEILQVGVELFQPILIEQSKKLML